MLKVLNNLPNQFLTSPPKLVSLLSDMAGIVAVKGLKNAVEAIATIIDSTADAATKAKWIYGRLYEFRVASFLKQQGASVEFIQQFVKEAKELGLTSTDIDIVANGVYYQVKSSAGAFGTGKQALDDVIEWVKKAKRHGQVNGNANPSIKYVVPDRTMVPDNVKDWLLSESIDIIEITF